MLEIKINESENAARIIVCRCGLAQEIMQFNRMIDENIAGVGVYWH